MAAMNYRRLGSSELEVSEISLGSWLTYSGGVSARAGRGVRGCRLRRGHQLHRHRQRLRARRRRRRCWARCSAGRERSSYVLATKVYFPMSDTDRGLSAEQIHKQIDASLARLQTDYVDLYQCHRFDSETPLEETMTALSEVVAEGKARHIGFSEWPVEEIERSLALPGRRALGLQPAAVLDARAHARRREVIPLCERGGHLADRLVAARAGRAGRALPPGRGAAGGLAGREREHGRLHRPADDRTGAARRSSACATSPSRRG